MKLIRWLLSHFFLILLIVIVIYSYMYWGNLAGKDTPAGKAITYLSAEFNEFGEFVEAVKKKQAGAPPESLQAAAPDESAPVSEPESKSEPESEPEPESKPEPEPKPEQMTGQQAGALSEGSVQAVSRTGSSFADTETSQENETRAGGTVEIPPVSLRYEYNKTPVNQTASAGSKMRSTDTEVRGVQTTPEARFVSEATVEQLNNVDSHGNIIDPAKQAEVIRRTWITARKAYYQRNYRLSEDSYRQVIEATQDNFDAWGELGNVYFNQGKKKAAADAYFQAAVILVDKKQLPRARSLIGLLRHLDRDKAVELHQLIESAGSGSAARTGTETGNR